MNSRSDKKTPKKSSAKQSSKMRSTMILRTPIDFTKEPLFMFVQFLLRKKYIERQLRTHDGEKIRKLIFSKFFSNQGRYREINYLTQVCKFRQIKSLQGLLEPISHHQA